MASDSLALASALARSARACKQLLVEVRRLDLGDHLAGLDPGADIGAPALQIAADAGENGSAIIGLQPARQIEGGAERLGIRQAHRDGRDGLFVCPFLQLGVGILARPDTRHHDQHRDDARHKPKNAQFPAGNR